MSNCKVCLKALGVGDADYHKSCASELFGVETLAPIKLSTTDCYRLDSTLSADLERRVGPRRQSIAGVQPKILVRFEGDELVHDPNVNTHILKPENLLYPHAVENEHVSMKASELLNVSSAQCGLVTLADGKLAYITQRFDRNKDGKRIALFEDLTQLLGINTSGNSDVKYQYSYRQALKQVRDKLGAD